MVRDDEKDGSWVRGERDKVMMEQADEWEGCSCIGIVVW